MLLVVFIASCFSTGKLPLMSRQHDQSTLMAEGIAKFANPQKALLAMVAKKREQLG